MTIPTAAGEVNEWEQEYNKSPLTIIKRYLQKLPMVDLQIYCDSL